MPVAGGAIVCAVAPIEVWRLVHDPMRLHEWMVDTERVEPAENGAVTRYLHGWPDYPMPTRMRTATEGGRVIISCLVSDMDIVVSLAPHPDGCAVAIEVEIPEAEAHRRDALQEVIDASLARLAERSAGAAPLG
jgi:hypothetical protein